MPFQTLQTAQITRYSQIICSNLCFQSHQTEWVPHCEKKNLNLKFPQHHHYTRSRENPLLPIARVNAVKINFKHQCTQIWNNLPHNIKSIPKLKPFKKALTSYFIDKYWQYTQPALYLISSLVVVQWWILQLISPLAFVGYLIFSHDIHKQILKSFNITFWFFLSKFIIFSETLIVVILFFFIYLP